MHGNGLREYSFQENYSTSGASMLEEFYAPALTRSIAYDRAAGYFSSAILALAPLAFSDFIARGGKIRLLCSPNLSEADAEAILDLPDSRRPDALEVAEASLVSLISGPRVQARAVACLRALIDAGVLEIRFVTVGKSGLYHEKIGIFADEDGSRLSFSGSANETAAAWSGIANHEGIEVFPDWIGESEERRCTRHADQFEETWQGLRRNLVVTDSKSAAEVVLKRVAPEPLDEILEEMRTAVREVEAEPDAISLRPYQEAVLKAWGANSDSGVVTFATGGGKTRTALEAVRRWTAQGKPALILVPTALLHRQWASELELLLPTTPVLLAGAGNDRQSWLRRLADYTREGALLGPRVVLATYRTAASEHFLSTVKGGDHLLLVADEVHCIGAADTRRIMSELPAGGRLGLSATPERYGDPTGTKSIFDFFGPGLQPEFRLRDALDAGVLVPYDYAFAVCQLTPAEQDSWDQFTEKIRQDMARNDGEISDYGLHLLRQRARIAKRAEGKADLARRIVGEQFATGDRWLVYCSDVEHLKAVRAKLEGMGLDLLEYHSQDSGDHDATLQYFQNRGGVLLAIKCLDEGIDIPLVNRALILASSTNPREYVQRRGRVLRRSPGKYSADLYDILVVGADGYSITPSEVRRAMEFARDARNVGTDLYLEELLPPGTDFASIDIEDE